MLADFSIKITTYNTHFGRKLPKIIMAFKENRNLRDSDIILLQEIEAYEGKGRAQAGEIADSLGLYCHYAGAREIIRLGKKGTHGLAVLSRHPIVSTHIIPLPYFRLPLHSRRRIAQLVRLKVGSRDLYVCNIHLDARINCQYRIRQLAAAVKYLKKLAPAPVILGGDFNTFPFLVFLKMLPLPYYNQYKRVHEFLLGQGFAYHTNFKGPTMRRGWLGMKVDHIYSNGLPIIECGVERSVTASDHKPVWAKIGIGQN